jgi:tetratricopeptide (TPR) repeat protein
VLLAYSNTFHASWHLDDITNILDNKHVHVSTLSFSDWAKSIHAPFSDPDNPRTGLSGLYRPVAMMSFAVNWYLGGRDVFGYHLVNLAIHCLTACVLYFTIFNLLQTPNIRDRYRGSEYFIAFLATALWALHPIQTQAVTYIVQRMASLSALFYLTGIYLFLKCHSARTPGRRYLLFGLCLLSYLLAIGTKQNTVTLPAVWLLLEIVFYIGPGFFKGKKIKVAFVSVLIGLMLFFSLLLFYWQENPFSVIAAGYQQRPFTLMERLLTEFRVMVFYLCQIFYPVPQQFSIVHDFAVSKSLLEPWTTAGALVLISTLIVGAFIQLRRLPLWSFSILFFFLGHSIESTIFPLELVFEHRNYLPSLFLFLPVAAGMKSLIDIYHHKNRLVYFLLIGSIPLLISGLGLGCYLRNSVWATEKLLWQDAMQKAPLLARPYQIVASALERENRLDEALFLYRKALTLKDPMPKLSRFISLGNMGNIYKKRKDFKTAVFHLNEAIKIEKGPYTHRVRHNLALCLINSNAEEKALEQFEWLLIRQKNDPRFLTGKGFILLRQGKADLALEYLQRALRQNPYDKNTLICLGMALSKKGFYDRAEWYLQTAKNKHPKNLVIYLTLLQNALYTQKTNRVESYLSSVTSQFTIGALKRYLTEHARGYGYIDETFVLIEDDLILPPLIDFLNQKIETRQYTLESTTE